MINSEENRGGRIIMECPKCKSKNILFVPANRRVSSCNKVRILKRYTCVKCNHNFDFI